MFKLEFNAAFRTDKAGRAANQDNGFCILDLSDTKDTASQNLNTDRTIAMGNFGSLFVVADGMGGMNAGEKASELIVKEMRKAFQALPSSMVGNPGRMVEYLVKSITEADHSIKAYASQNPETRGMGSTVVALWIYGDMAIAAWVGDSRIYRYNPTNGLIRLSHDHSYVQNLVDTGKLPEHLAFDHPDSNIITRSLGDNGETVKPETRIYKVYDRDEFLLCSDGLCGLLTDEEIEQVMESHQGSSKSTLDELWKKGEAKGWSDNATIEIVCVAGELPQPHKGKPDGYPSKIIPTPRKLTFGSKNTVEQKVSEAAVNKAVPIMQNDRKFNSLRLFIIAAVVVCGVLACFYFMNTKNEELDDDDLTGIENVEEGYDAVLDDINDQYENINDILKDYGFDYARIPVEKRGQLASMARNLLDDCNGAMKDSNLTAQTRNTLQERIDFARKIEGLLVAGTDNTPSTQAASVKEKPRKQTPSTPTTTGDGVEQKPRQPEVQTPPQSQPEQAPAPAQAPTTGPEKPTGL